MNKEQVKNYKYLVWHGLVSRVECKQHSYAWSGSMPCTGRLRCIYCGKPKDN